MNLDPVRLHLLKLLQSRVPPTDMAGASVAIGRNRTYLHQYVYKGSPKKLPEDVRHELAKFLACDEAELKHDGPPERRGRPRDDQPVNLAALYTAGLVGIPEIDVRASAGPGAIVDGEAAEIDKWYLPETMIRHELRAEPKYLRIITVEGDSMLPFLPSGSRILIDTARRAPSPPGIFVLWDGLGLVAKQVEIVPDTDPIKLVIKSQNVAYQTYERVADEVNIVGRVIWAAQRI